MITSLRVLRRRGPASVLALTALSLGIGLPTALFSVLDGVALKGLPFPDGDRIVSVTTIQGYDWPMPPRYYQTLVMERLEEGTRRRESDKWVANRLPDSHAGRVSWAI